MDLIPQGEADEHSHGELCQCRPTPLVDASGEVVWQHKSISGADGDLLEQAEKIRMAESVDLWAKAELKHKKLSVVPFQSLNPIKLPKSHPRL